ncbi:Uncharacterized protein family UPF0728 [Popillia japonica]|uniref:Uncharacterized protein family UPF0728 n=1 Tax=Popillia japonica TaxID=7064 RepID=A0AAW1MC61_POPJA
MPLVVLSYGPYEAHGAVKYRTQRLHGLLRGLTQKQYEVEIIPSIHLNRLDVKMLENIIFQCDIRNLLFNIDYESDPVCMRIIAVIEEAEARFFADRNVPRFIRKGYPPDYLKSLSAKEILEHVQKSSIISLLYEHSKHIQPKQNSEHLVGSNAKIETSHGSYKRLQQNRMWSPSLCDIIPKQSSTGIDETLVNRKFAESVSYDIMSDIINDVVASGSELLISEDFLYSNG